MKRGLKLRRFRSEVNIEDNKSESSKSGITLSLEPRGDPTDIIENSLSHAVSQPDMLARMRQSSPKTRPRPNGTY